MSQVLTSKLKVGPSVVCDGVQRTMTWHPTGTDIYVKYLSAALYGINQRTDAYFGFVWIQKNHTESPGAQDCVISLPLFLGRDGNTFVEKNLQGDSILLAANETMIIEVYADPGAPWGGLTPFFEMAWTTTP